MNKLIKAGAAVLAAMLVSTSAFADGITVSTDYSTGNVSVSCDFGIGKKPVTVRVIGPLSAPADYEDVSETAADKIFEESYVNQLYTDEAGSISLTLPIGNKAANYIIAMNCGGDKQIYYYFSASPEKIAELIEKINAAKTGDEIYNILSDDDAAKNLNITSGVYSELSEKAKKKVCEAVCGGSFDGYDAFLKRLNVFSSVFYLNDGKSADKAEEYVNKYIDLQGLEMYEEVQKLDDSQKKNVFSRMMNISISSVEDLKKGYEESVFLEMISSVIYSDNITQIINKYASKFSINTNGYSKYSKSVNRKIESYAAKGGFSNLNEFKEKFSAFIKEASDSSSSGGGSSSGSSSSGGSSGSRPANKVSVTVSSHAEQESESALPFDDISDFSWVHKAIRYLSGKNIVNGKGGGRFAPSDNVTREEFVKIICGAFSLPDGQDVDFTDADKNAWYYDFVKNAYGSGIIKGRDDGSFGIGDAISREDGAVIIMRALENAGAYVEGTQSKTFADSDKISEYARSAVENLSKTNIINGDGENFRPQSHLTRAEACKMIYEAIML